MGMGLGVTRVWLWLLLRMACGTSCSRCTGGVVVTVERRKIDTCRIQGRGRRRGRSWRLLLLLLHGVRRRHSVVVVVVVWFCSSRRRRWTLRRPTVVVVTVVIVLLLCLCRLVVVLLLLLLQLILLSEAPRLIHQPARQGELHNRLDPRAGSGRQTTAVVGSR